MSRRVGPSLRARRGLRRSRRAVGVLCAALLAGGGLPVRAAETELVSVSIGGGPADSISLFPSISADGRFVAFTSFAQDLVPGYSSQWQNVFVRDRVAGQTFQASLTAAGDQPGGDSPLGTVSADGNRIAFESFASQLVPGVGGFTAGIFVRDRVAGSTVLASVSTGGEPANSFSLNPVISDDGCVVAFEHVGDNLVPDDLNGQPDIFVHDCATGTTTRVSVRTDGGEAGAGSTRAAMSPDGRHVAFYSHASNLAADDSNGVSDVYVHDRTTGVTDRASIGAGGLQPNQPSAFPSVSATGRFVAFASDATNLVPGDTNGASDVFVRDRRYGTTTRISVTSLGGQAAGASTLPSISADGRFVAFTSEAPNLVPGDANGIADAFLHDRFAGTTVRASVASDGTEANYGAVGAPRISADGRFVAFQSWATTLVPGTGGNTNVYVRSVDRDVPLCLPQPARTCRRSLRAPRARLVVRSAPVGSRKGPQIQWRWTDGAATALDELGLPTVATQYALCMYTRSGPFPVPVFQARAGVGGDCAAGTCWRSRGTRGFAYRSRDRGPEGLSAIKLVPGEDGRASVVVKAQGMLLDLPALPLALPVVVQLQAGNAQCWEATYSQVRMVRNDAAEFRGAAD